MARGEVFERHVVGDDELVEVSEEKGVGGCLGVDEEAGAALEDVCIGLDAALGTQEEGIATLAVVEALDVIRAHGVEQSRVILAVGEDAAAGTRVTPGGGGAEGLVALHGRS